MWVLGIGSSSKLKFEWIIVPLKFKARNKHLFCFSPLQCQTEILSLFDTETKRLGDGGGEREDLLQPYTAFLLWFSNLHTLIEIRFLSLKVLFSEKAGNF